MKKSIRHTETINQGRCMNPIWHSIGVLRLRV